MAEHAIGDCPECELCCAIGLCCAAEAQKAALIKIMVRHTGKPAHECGEYADAIVAATQAARKHGASL